KGIGNYEVFNSENFYQKKGILPKQIVDLKGLMGDSADNYPGVKGIGEKTALKLLKEYGSVENILASFDQLTKGLQKKITTDLKLLHLSRDLAEIKRDVPVSCDPDEEIWNVDIKKAEKKFAQFEMEKLLEFLDADQPLTK